MMDETGIVLPSGRVLARQDVQEQYIRASGPGGQKVNTSSSAVQLRLKVRGASSFSPAMQERILRRLASRITRSGELVIEASEFRSRHRNREAALERLDRLLALAVRRAKPRRATAPTKASQKRRIEQKKRRGAVKKNRNRPPLSD